MSFDQFKYLTEQMTNQFGFEADHAESAANRLVYDDRIYEAVTQYMHSGNVVDVEIAGHSITSLINNYGLDPIGAYLMLVEFAADPQKGEGYLADIIEHGHVEPIYENGEVLEIEFSSVPAAETQNQNPVCQKCGKPTTWIDQYKRWYCHECKEYV